MNKVWTFMLLFITLTLLTIMVESIGYTSTDLTIYQGGLDISLSGLKDILFTFGRLITFQIVEVPSLFTALVIWPITMGFIYLVIDIAKDLVPLT